MNNQRKIIIIGTILGGLAVGFGAFGAHALKTILLSNGRSDTFELAVRYQFYHAFALLIVAALIEKLNPSKSSWAVLLLTCGTIVFSGSLYILSLSGSTIWGAVTPVGGVLLLAGWSMFLLSVKK